MHKSPVQSRDIQVMWAHRPELGLLGKSSVRAPIWPTQDLHSHHLSMGLRAPLQLRLGAP